MFSRYVFLNLLYFANRNGFLKQFSFYVFFKEYFEKNTIIYNFTYHKIAKMIGIHPKTAERYVKKLIQQKYCEIYGNNLHFRSQAKITKDLELKFKGGKALECELDQKDILNNFYKIFLKINANRQEYRIKKPADNGTALLQHPENRDFNIYFSGRSIGRLLNCSHVTGLKRLKRLHKEKYLFCKRWIEKIRKITWDEFSQIIYSLNDQHKGYYFYKAQTLWVDHGWKIEEFA